MPARTATTRRRDQTATETPVTDPAIVERQAAAMLEAHRLSVSRAMAAIAQRSGYGSSSLRTMRQNLDLPETPTLRFDVSVQWLNVPARSAEHAAELATLCVTNIRTDEGTIRASGPQATPVAPPASEQTEPVPSTVAGREAGTAAIRDWDARFYQALVASHQEFSDRTRDMGVTPPPTQEYTVMVPLTVTAFDRNAALLVAGYAVRSGFRAVQYGQTDYVRSGPPEIVTPTEGESSAAQPVTPADA